jgi:hypothetical protein
MPVIAVLHRLHSNQPAQLAQALRQHIQRHSHLGLQITVAYAQTGLLGNLLQQPAVTALVESHQLALVKWDVIAPVMLVNGTISAARHDAQAVIQHAALSHVASGALLLHMDVHDTLVLPGTAAQADAAVETGASAGSAAQSQVPLVALVSAGGCLHGYAQAALRIVHLAAEASGGDSAAGGGANLEADHGTGAALLAHAKDSAGCAACANEHLPAVLQSPAAMWAGRQQSVDVVPPNCAFAVRRHVGE